MTQDGSNRHIALADLQLYHSGTLPQRSVALVESHLGDCSDCRAAFNAVAAIEDLYTEWIGALNPDISAALQRCASFSNATYRARLVSWERRVRSRPHDVRGISERSVRLRIRAGGSESKDHGALRISVSDQRIRAGRLRMRGAGESPPLGAEVEVRIEKRSDAHPNPLVLLIPQDEGQAPIPAALEFQGAEESYGIARFPNVPPGDYVIVVESA